MSIEIEIEIANAGVQINARSGKIESPDSSKIYIGAIKTHSNITFRIFLSYPVTACSYERSISLFNRVKCHNQTHKLITIVCKNTVTD